jgi:hypothetical protein
MMKSNHYFNYNFKSIRGTYQEIKESLKKL